MIRNNGKEIGLAVIGCGTIGRIRSEFAKNYLGVGWIGLCDIKEDLGRKLEKDVGADFFTTSAAELLARPEVTAAIIATDENNHMNRSWLLANVVYICLSKSRWLPMRLNQRRY